MLIRPDISCANDTSTRRHLSTRPMNVKSCTTMWPTIGRVTVAMLLVTAAAGPPVFGQKAKPTPSPAPSIDLTPVLLKGQWGYADKDGNVVIKPQFTLAHSFSEGLALVWVGGDSRMDPEEAAYVKMGYIDSTGHWVIHSRTKYYLYYDFSEGLVSFRHTSNKWGYMDKRGKEVIRPQFDWAGTFLSGVAPVVSNGRCAHIDKAGRITDQSPTIIPEGKYLRDKHGVFRSKPEPPPCQ